MHFTKTSLALISLIQGVAAFHFPSPGQLESTSDFEFEEGECHEIFAKMAINDKSDEEALDYSMMALSGENADFSDSKSYVGRYLAGCEDPYGGTEKGEPYLLTATVDGEDCGYYKQGTKLISAPICFSVGCEEIDMIDFLEAPYGLYYDDDENCLFANIKLEPVPKNSPVLIKGKSERKRQMAKMKRLEAKNKKAEDDKPKSMTVEDMKKQQEAALEKRRLEKEERDRKRKEDAEKRKAARKR
jgi:hypothetical protein